MSSRWKDLLNRIPNRTRFKRKVNPSDEDDEPEKPEVTPSTEAAPSVRMNPATIAALHDLLSTYNASVSNEIIEEGSHIIPDQTKMEAIDKGVQLAGELAGTIVGDIGSKLLKYFVMKYTDFATTMFGTIVPPEFKTEGANMLLDSTDANLLLALNTLIVQRLNEENTNIIHSHLSEHPRNNVYYPGHIFPNKIPWKEDDVEGLGLGDDDFDWSYDGVIKSQPTSFPTKGGGIMTKRSRTKRSRTKRSRTKRSRTKRSRTKRSRTKRSRTKRSRTKRSRTKRSRTKRSRTKRSRTKRNRPQ